MSDLEEIISLARKKEIEVGEFEAEAFLRARALLAVDKTNEVAKEVTANFLKHLTTGKRTKSFAEFMI